MRRDERGQAGRQRARGQQPRRAPGHARRRGRGRIEAGVDAREERRRFQRRLRGAEGIERGQLDRAAQGRQILRA